MGSAPGCFDEVEDIKTPQQDAGTGQYASSGSFIPGSGASHGASDIDRVFGAPDGEFLSMGAQGSLDVSFDDRMVIDGLGGDIRIHASFDQGEKATVYGSLTGARFEVITDITESNDLVDMARGGFAELMYLRIRDSGQGDGIEIDAIEVVNLP